MWWHVDLPASLSLPQATETVPEPGAQGQFLLEWILPTLAGEVDREATVLDGGERRALRKGLREGEAD